MTALPTRLETVRLPAPLGLRFVDAATRRIVTNGLRVTAHPTGSPYRRVESVLTPSGVHAFHTLPGLGLLPDSDDANVAADRARPEPAKAPSDDRSNPSRGDVTVEANDALGRFLPLRLKVKATPGGTEDPVPLYSAPSRSPLPGMAGVYLELTGAGAAWAQLEVEHPNPTGPPYRALADRWGRLRLLLPYPEPETVLPEDPIDLRGQRWKLHVRVARGPDDAPEDAPAVPERSDLDEAWTTRRIPWEGEVILAYGRPYFLDDNDADLKEIRLGS